MIGHDFYLAIGWVATVMGWFLTLVQLRRAWKVSTDGIALSTWLTFIFATIFWAWYGLAVHDPVVLWSSIVIFPIQFLIIIRIERKVRLKQGAKCFRWPGHRWLFKNTHTQKSRG